MVVAFAGWRVEMLSVMRVVAVIAAFVALALGAGLGRLLALSEAYPDLKANTTMRELSEELTSTENKVAFARQAYNDAVTEYNNGREVFPAVLFAGAFGFGDDALLEATESAEERRAPKVSFT